MTEAVMPAQHGGAGAILAILIFFMVTLFVMVAFALFHGWLWVRAWTAGAHVSMLELLGRRFRGVSPKVVVQALIKAAEAGVPLEMRALETHCLAGGNAWKVVNAMIAAHKADVPLSFDQACPFDLQGHDPMRAVEECAKAETEAESEEDAPASSQGTA